MSLGLGLRIVTPWSGKGLDEQPIYKSFINFSRGFSLVLIRIKFPYSEKRKDHIRTIAPIPIIIIKINIGIGDSSLPSFFFSILFTPFQPPRHTPTLHFRCEKYGPVLYPFHLSPWRAFQESFWLILSLPIQKL